MCIRDSPISHGRADSQPGLLPDLGPSTDVTAGSNVSTIADHAVVVYAGRRVHDRVLTDGRAWIHDRSGRDDRAFSYRGIRRQHRLRMNRGRKDESLFSGELREPDTRFT